MKGNSTTHIYTKQGRDNHDQIQWNSNKPQDGRTSEDMRWDTFTGNLANPGKHGMPTGKQVEHRHLLHSLTHRNGTNIKD